TETVPQNRTSLGWIARRSLRIGVINYRVRSKAAQSAGARARLFALTLGRLPLSLMRSARLMTSSKGVVAIHPMLVAVGSALAAFGYDPKPYEASKIVS
ncbi:hypothetical protein QT607_22690, partial [Xanthomonas citri pv. citri]